MVRLPTLFREEQDSVIYTPQKEDTKQRKALRFYKH